MRRLGGLGLLILALSACGAKSESDRVRDTLNAYRDATAHRDYGALCTRILAPEALTQLQRSNIPCEEAVARFLGPTKQPELTIRKITVKGDTATAQVDAKQAGQAKPAPGTLTLTKVKGEWRISG